VMGGVVVLGGAAAGQGQQARERVITVPTRPRVMETVVVVRPPTKPVANVLVLVGGPGKLDLTPLGLSRRAPGPLTTRREQLAGRGFVVAFVDAPSDRLGGGVGGLRRSREHPGRIRP